MAQEKSKKRTLTRGERNHNPGNIERNKTKWQGMSEDQSGDSRFVVFSSPVWGIRALAKTLLTYSNKYAAGTPQDIDTVREFINRWAPPVENNTESYINAVAKALSVEPDEAIDITQPTVLKALVVAIIKHENGRCMYGDDVITQGVMKALN